MQKLNESLSQWLQHPLTKEVFKILHIRREELVEGLINGNESNRYRIKELDMLLKPEELNSLFEER